MHYGAIKWDLKPLGAYFISNTTLYITIIVLYWVTCIYVQCNNQKM